MWQVERWWKHISQTFGRFVILYTLTLFSLWKEGAMKRAQTFSRVCAPLLFPFFLRAQLLGIFFYSFPVSSKREGERGGEREIERER